MSAGRTAQLYVAGVLTALALRFFKNDIVLFLVGHASGPGFVLGLVTMGSPGIVALVVGARLRRLPPTRERPRLTTPALRVALGISIVLAVAALPPRAAFARGTRNDGFDPGATSGACFLLVALALYVAVDRRWSRRAGRELKPLWRRGPRTGAATGTEPVEARQKRAATPRRPRPRA